MSEDSPELGDATQSNGRPGVDRPPLSRDVFVSYASQDAAVANSVVEALESQGIRCWIAPRDVTPGEFYAGVIVHAIDAAKATVLILSQHSAASPHVVREVERAASKRHPVISLRIDRAPLPADLEYFLNTSQWLDASEEDVGRAMPKLVEAVRKIVAGGSATAGGNVIPSESIRESKRRSFNRPLAVALAVVVVAIVGFAIERFWLSKHVAEEKPATQTSAAAAFAPPPHSIAVLPFVNMSGDASQEYFSDGLTEELLNSLARFDELQVAARTSAFSFKGKDTDIGAIARKLNVGTVLEGSVRRSGNTVRITAELINAVTGFHVWSKSFDRDLGDLLTLQSEIANAVASALRVTLLGDESAKVELGGTHSPAAFDAYLHARKAQLAGQGAEGYQTAIARFTEAVNFDPKYALAFAGRAVALVNYGGLVPEPDARECFDKAHEDALRAIALAPGLAEAHLAIAAYFDLGLDFARANEEYERALALGSGNARVLQDYGQFAVMMGHKQAGIAAVRRAQLLDPLDPATNDTVGYTLLYAREYQEAVAAFQATITLNPGYSDAYVHRGLAYFALGNLQGARASCESKPDYLYSRECLAIVYDRLRRHADAAAQLAKVKALQADSDAYQYAEIYAQWGDTTKALKWLETALRLRDSGLDQLKMDPFLDPVRSEPRFRAIEARLSFPP